MPYKVPGKCYKNIPLHHLAASFIIRIFSCENKFLILLLKSLYCIEIKAYYVMSILRVPYITK
jgi:hypothetical protein